MRSAVDQAMSDFSLLPVITGDRQLCLVAAFAELSLGHQLDLAAEAEPGMDRLRDLRGQLSIGVMARGDLDLDRNRWRDRDFLALANDSRASRDAGSKLANDGQDGRRVDVHPSHDE